MGGGADNGVSDSTVTLALQHESNEGKSREEYVQ